MGRKNKKTIFLEKLKEGKGIITYASQAAKVPRATHYYWMKNDPEYARKVELIEEETLDVVESKLLNKINDGDLTATIFYLKTKGKKRGYVENINTNITINPFEQLMKELPDKD